MLSIFNDLLMHVPLALALSSSFFYRRHKLGQLLFFFGADKIGHRFRVVDLFLKAQHDDGVQTHEAVRFIHLRQFIAQ